MTDSTGDPAPGGREPARPEDLLRIGNADRERVVVRVQDAFAEGRLTAEELQQRLDAVYRARTVGELRPLTADLPAVSEPPPGSQRPARPPRPAPARRVRPAGQLHPALRVLWIIWTVAVAVNVAVWLVVCVTTGDLIYGWPLWVAGPAGTALLVLTIMTRPTDRPDS